MRSARAPRPLLIVAGVVFAIHVAAGLALVSAGSGSTGTVLVALAGAAYLLGVRHALDVDHIAAIDNVTRRLVERSRDSTAVGLWFALGHSSVVVAAVVTVSFGARALGSEILTDGSAVRTAASTWGALVSGLFLLTLAALNARTLLALLRARRPHVPGDPVQDAERPLGVAARLLGPVAHLIRRPRRMFAVGFLFGLGLDTAATVIALVLGAGLLGGGLAGVLVLPLAFTAGMALADSADGVAMARIYRWASDDRGRRLNYSIVVTALSTAVAALVGGSGLIALGADAVRVSLELPDAQLAGVVVIAAFAVSWVVALASRRSATGATSFASVAAAPPRVS